MAYLVLTTSQINIYNKNLKKEFFEMEDYVHNDDHQLEKMNISCVLEILIMHDQWKGHVEHKPMRSEQEVMSIANP